MTDRPINFLRENATMQAPVFGAPEIVADADFAPAADVLDGLAETTTSPEMPPAELAVGGTACDGAEVTVDWSRVDCNGMLHDAATGKFLRKILAHEMTARPKPVSVEPPIAEPIPSAAKSCTPSRRRRPRDPLAWAMATTGAASEFSTEFVSATLAPRDADLAVRPALSTDSLGGLLHGASSKYADLSLPDPRSRAASKRSSARPRPQAGLPQADTK